MGHLLIRARPAWLASWVAIATLLSSTAAFAITVPAKPGAPLTLQLDEPNTAICNVYPEPRVGDCAPFADVSNEALEKANAPGVTSHGVAVVQFEDGRRFTANLLETESAEYSRTRAGAERLAHDFVNGLGKETPAGSAISTSGDPQSDLGEITRLAVAIDEGDGTESHYVAYFVFGEDRFYTMLFSSKAIGLSTLERVGDEAMKSLATTPTFRSDPDGAKSAVKAKYKTVAQISIAVFVLLAMGGIGLVLALASSKKKKVIQPWGTPSPQGGVPHLAHGYGAAPPGYGGSAAAAPPSPGAAYAPNAWSPGHAQGPASYAPHHAPAVIPPERQSSTQLHDTGDDFPAVRPPGAPNGSTSGSTWS